MRDARSSVLLTALVAGALLAVAATASAAGSHARPAGSTAAGVRSRRAARSTRGAAPLRVADTSLAQSARSVVWRLEMTRPFSAAVLARTGRTLCLLIERRRSGAVSGQLCLVGPSPGASQPRLAYAPVRHGVPGPARAVPAAVHHDGRRLTAALRPTAFGDDYRSVRWQVRSTLEPPACTPRRGHNPLGCVRLSPTSPRLAALHVPRLVGCTARGPDMVFDRRTNRREIALTFDDGPFPDTPAFLDILERERVPATFFEIGDQIASYGEHGAIERRMLADGDMIGDHTWSHPQLGAPGPSVSNQIEGAAAAIRGATGGFTPCLFRTPYGVASSAVAAQARSLGFTTIQWDIDPRDWASPGVGAIVDNVLGHAHPGAIVVQHDGGGYRTQTLAALPEEIAGLRGRGYRFVTVTRLLGERLIYR